MPRFALIQTPRLAFAPTSIWSKPVPNQLKLFLRYFEYGLEKIEEGKTVRFEVIGMPSKVIFQSRILKKMGAGGVVCELPPALISIERRAATRANTSPRMMAYMSLGVWNPTATALMLHRYLSITGKYSIGYRLDISGGVCLNRTFHRCKHRYLELNRIVMPVLFCQWLILW